MAAPNDTLYGLAAHLQTMENNLTDFIFHCALRLSTMTDSRVFVLMENPNDGSGRRRFCGNSSLVEEFANRGLHLRPGSDFEMELNQDSPPVREKQLQQVQQLQRFQLPVQQQQQQQHDAGIGTKRRGASNGTPTDYDDDSSKKRRVGAETGAVVENGSTQDSSRIPECKKEEIEEFIIDSDSNDETTTTMGNDSNYNNSSLNGFTLFDSFEGSVHGSNANDSTMSSTSLTFTGDVGDTPSRRIGLDVPTLVAKEQAVASIADPSKAFIRGSMENKLLASICYDAGKSLTLSAPHPVDTPLFREHCKERIHAYVEQFPRFVNVTPGLAESTALLGKDGVTPLYTPESFMKMNARNGYKRALMAMKKAGGGCG